MYTHTCTRMHARMHTHTHTHTHTYTHTHTESPNPPENVEIVSFGARWVSISWSITFNGNRPVNRVIISANSAANRVEFTVNTMATSYNVSTLLLPFTSYTFAVVACNVVGCSTQSDLSPAVMTLSDSKSISYTRFCLKSYLQQLYLPLYSFYRTAELNG